MTLVYIGDKRVEFGVAEDYGCHVVFTKTEPLACFCWQVSQCTAPLPRRQCQAEIVAEESPP